MSATIDSKIVEMQFDNSQFERNVATSMSTLDKLKNALKFDKASTGLEGLGNAIKRFDLGGLTSGVDSASNKFSAMQIAGITAIANITNSAVNAGKQLVKSLSVDQITAGFSKYGEKTKAVATLVAQGYALESVNEQLERLNWFSDETSYNFTDMVENIAKFTATGQDLETSVTAMEGIANWASLSGQNAQVASRAMYQLSQAMGAGVMRMEDYRSIQNLSMDTQEFRQKAIDAAIELGTLKKVSEDTYQSLVATGKQGKEAFNINQFAAHLTQGAWFTSDVMMKVYNEYSSAVSDIYEYAEEKGITASEAISEMGDKLDEFGLKAFKASQEARTFEDVVDSVKDAASTAWMNTFELIFGNYEEATELWTNMANEAYDIFVGPLNSMNEILEEAFGKKERPVTWEDITGLHLTSDQGEGLIKVLKSVANEHGIAIDQIIKDKGSFKKSLEEGWLSSEIFEEAINKFTGESKADLEEIHTLATDVIKGAYGDSWDARKEKLAEAGYTEETIQLVRDYVNELAKYKKDGSWDLSESVWEAVDAEKGNAEALASMSDEELKAIGLTEKQIEGLRELAKTAEETGTPLNELYDSLYENKSGRELFLESFQNIYEVAQSIMGRINKAWKEVFGGDAAEMIRNIIERFHSFTESLELSGVTGLRIKLIFKGIFSIFKILGDALGALASVLLPIVGGLFGDMVNSFIKVATSVGKFVTSISKATSESKTFEKIANAIAKPLNAIRTVLGKVIDISGTFISKVFDKLRIRLPEISERFDKLITTIENTQAFQKLSELANNAFESVMNFLGIKFSDENLENGANGVVDTLLNAMDTLTTWIEEADKFVQENGVEGVFTYIKDKIVEGLKSLPGAIHDALFGVKEQTGEELQEVIEGSAEAVKPEGIVTYIAQHIATAISTVATEISNYLFGAEVTEKIKKVFTDIFGDINLEDIFGSLKEKFSTYFTEFLPGIFDFLDTLNIDETLKNSLTAFLDKLGITAEGIDIMKVVKEVLSLLAGFSIAKFLKGLSDIPESISGLFEKLGKSVKSITKVTDGMTKDFKASAMLKQAGAFALVLGVLVAGVYVLGNMKPEALDQGLTAVTKLAIVAGIIIGVLTLISSITSIIKGKQNPLTTLFEGITDTFKRAQTLKKAGKIGLLVAGFGAGILMLVKAFIDLTTVDWKNATPAIIAMLAFVGGLVGVVYVLQKMPGKVPMGTVLSILAIALAIRMLVPVLVTLSGLSWGELIKGVGSLLLLLVAMAGSVRLMGSGGSLGSAVTLIALAGALNMLVGPVTKLAKLKLSELAKGIGGVSVLLIALVASLSIVSKFGNWGVILTMSVFVGSLSLLLFAIAILPVDTALPVILGLSALLMAMSGAIAILGNMPPIAGLMAALNIVEFIGVLVLGVIGICELISLIPNIDEVQDILIGIGETIGRFVGAIGKGISDALPSIGENLGAFADNASSFFDLGGDKLSSVTTVAEMLKTLADVAASDWITRLLSFGHAGLLETIQTTFMPLAEELNKFAEALGPELSSGKIESASAVVEMLKVLSGLSETTSISFLGVFTATTTKDLAGFGEGLSTVAEGLGKFVQTLATGGFEDITPESMALAKEILSFMCDIQDRCPTSVEFAGKLGEFSMHSGLGDFGEGLAKVGLGLATFAVAVKGCEFEEGELDNAVKIIELMAGVQDTTPITTTAQFGNFASFSEHTGIGEFGEGMAKVGLGLAMFAVAVKGCEFEEGELENAVKIIELMAGVQDTTPITTTAQFGNFATFSEHTGIGEFGEGMGKVGVGLSTFAEAVKTCQFDGELENATAIIELMAGVQSSTPITQSGFFSELGLFSSSVTGLGDFGEGMGETGKGLAIFAEAVKDCTFDGELENATKIIDLMVGVQSSTPLTETSFFSGLGIFSSTVTGLGDFGKGMGETGKGLSTFAEAVKGCKFDGELEDATSIIKLMADVQSSTPVTETSFFSGLGIFSTTVTGLGDFGKGMGEVGKGLAEFMTAIKDVTFEGDLETAQAIISFMASIQSQTPISESEYFLGLKTFSSTTGLGDFGKGMVEVANGLGEFMNSLSMGTFNPFKILMAEQVIGFFSDLNTKLPTSSDTTSLIGKLVAFAGGKSEMEKFGEGMTFIAGGLASFMNAMNEQGVDPEMLNTAITCITQLADFGSSYSGQGNNLGDIGQEMITFGSNIASFSGYMTTFYTAIKDWKLGEFIVAKTCIDSIKEPIESILGLNFDNIETIKSGLETFGGIDFSTLFGDVSAQSGSIAEAVSGIMSAFKEGFQNSGDLTEITGTISGALNDALTEISGLNDSFDDAGEAVITNFKSGITSSNPIGEIKKSFSDLMKTVLETCKKYAEFATAGRTNALSFLGGIISQHSTIRTTFNEPLTTCLSNINGYKTSFNTAGSDLASKFYSGLKSKNSNIKTVLSGAIGPEDTAGTALAKLSAYKQSFYNMGAAYASQLNSGLGGKSMLAQIKQTAANLGSTAANAARRAIRSVPTTPPANNNTNGPTNQEMGMVGPLIFGPGNVADKVTKKSAEIGKIAASNIGSAIKQASKLLDEGIDAQPTIRPVLDLSDVNSGMRLLGGMFGNQSIGVAGNISAIASMRGSNQDVTNADVITAINGLQKTLKDQPRNSYTINGITYDDGSNITSAVKELVKAVRIEKRA